MDLPCVRYCSFVVLRNTVPKMYCSTKSPLDVTLTHVARLSLDICSSRYKSEIYKQLILNSLCRSILDFPSISFVQVHLERITSLEQKQTLETS